MGGDLHCHTKLSDGSLGIKDLIALAKRCGVDTIAIADHDCLAGTVRGRIIGERLGVRLRSGHDARERPALGPGKVRDKNGAQGTAADDGGSLHDGSPMFDNSQEPTATQ